MKIDYEKYLVRKPVYEAFGGIKNRQRPAMTYMSGVQVPGVKYYIEVGWVYGIPEPNPGINEHMHDHDEIVIYWGGSHESPQVLGGEIEFHVGGQALTFDTTSALFILRGLRHGPLRLKEYRQPHIVMAIMCGAGTIKEGWGDSFMTGQNQEKK